MTQGPTLSFTCFFGSLDGSCRYTRVQTSVSSLVERLLSGLHVMGHDAPNSRVTCNNFLCCNTNRRTSIACNKKQVMHVVRDILVSST